MKVTRRGFMKVTGIGAVCIAFAQVGCAASKPVKAHASNFKLQGAKEVISICGFCSVSCHLICHVKDGKVISAEGDPGYPISEGSLCAKGAATLAMINSDHRLFKPKYRAPYSDRWEEKSWDWILTRLATRIKETRDRDFRQFNDNKEQVNRVDSMFHLGSSQLDNEECAIVHQAIRALGVVHFDHQARI